MKMINRRNYARYMFSNKRQIAFFRKMESFLKADIPQTAALNSLHTRATEHGSSYFSIMAIALGEWKRKTERGVGLSEAMTGWIPDNVRMSLQSSEEGGSMAAGLEGAIKNLEFTGKVESVLSGIVLSVVVYALALCATIVFYSIEILPSFTAIYDRGYWTGLAGQLFWVSDNLWAVVSIIIMTVIMIIVGLRIALPNWRGISRAYADRLPGFSIYRLNTGLAFLDALINQLDSGQSIPSALEALSREGTPYLRERLVKATRAVDSGRNLGEALHNTGYGFPDRELVLDIRDHADVGNHRVLKDLVKEWRKEGLRRIERDGKLLTTLVLSLFFLVVAWLIYAVFDIQIQIQSTIGF